MKHRTVMLFFDENGEENGMLIVQNKDLTITHVNDRRMDEFQSDLLRRLLKERGVEI